MYEKKIMNNVEHVSSERKDYKKPQLIKLGNCKTHTKGGQIHHPVDGSGWANKNTDIPS